MQNKHEKWIKYCYLLAENSRKKGFNAFGAVLVHGGELIASSENLDTNFFRPYYGHAEWALVNKIALQYSDKFLAECIFYTSTYPCERCLLGLAACGIKQIVYGVSLEKFHELCCRDKTTKDYLKIINDEFNLGIIIEGPILENKGLDILLG